MIQNLCIYCGSSDKVRPQYLEAAAKMGRALAQRNMRLIYGAGSTGLMGAVADAALSNGAEVIGVLPQMFHTPQLAHTRLTRLEIVDSMHTRKARLAELADAFVALPGGFGTFDEWFEIITWAQIGLHCKPIGLLNSHGYYDPLLALVEHANREGMIYSEHSRLFVQAAEPDALLDALEEFERPSGLERWVERPSF